MPETPDAAFELPHKIREWLNHEGYPLEFATANQFRRQGFSVRQGLYVREGDAESPREIDVAASVTIANDDSLLRIYHVIECKWSRDKPWVVFSGDHGMSPAACVTQTISNELGSAILWKDAGAQALHDLDLFVTPDRSGFNGRQAFSKGTDFFYNSMCSVTALSTLLAQQYDDEHRPRGTMPRNAVVAFPVIVIDGRLFEAFCDSERDDTQIAEVNRVRCHWRGSPAWPYHATVDIVTASHLQDFAERRRDDVRQLANVMRASQEQIAQCFRAKSLTGLGVTEGSRGVLGLHPLLHELVRSKRPASDPQQLERKS
jgi:hypothetical protein